MYSARLEIAQFADTNSFCEYFTGGSIWNIIDVLNIGFLTYISMTALITGADN